MMPQLIPALVCDFEAIKDGTVCANGSLFKMKAKAYSFHATMMQNTAVAAIPGHALGNVTLKKAWMRG